VQKPLATALGAGVRVDGDTSRAVIDQGAGLTSVGVMAMGMSTTSLCVRFGGDDVDEVIRRAVKRAQGISIGAAAAEQIKLQVGTLLPAESNDSVRVDGAAGDGEAGAAADVSLADVPEVLLRALSRIVAEVAWLLEELPPSQHSEVAAAGAVLAGGGALLGAADAYLAERLGIPVQVATDPLSCTILGLEAVLNDPHAVSLEGRRFRTSPV
jgi:rod shape-determining protein MreB